MVKLVYVLPRITRKERKYYDQTYPPHEHELSYSAPNWRVVKFQVEKYMKNYFANGRARAANSIALASQSDR